MAQQTMQDFRAPKVSRLDAYRWDTPSDILVTALEQSRLKAIHVGDTERAVILQLTEQGVKAGYIGAERNDSWREYAFTAQQIHDWGNAQFHMVVAMRFTHHFRGRRQLPERGMLSPLARLLEDFGLR